MYKRAAVLLSFLTTVFSFLFFVPAAAYADHTWGGYHWARTGNPFVIKLGDNVTSAWDQYLSTSSADWSLSSVLDTAIVAGGTTAKRCRATNGSVEICNSAYGNNGWLGIAQVWVSGAHITQGTVKMNDTYFKTTKYNTPAWKNLVMCQEVGHTFGLDHQDEDFANASLGTCMDYSNDPLPNQHPNQHDYDQLENIYAHLDAITTVGQIVSGQANGEYHSRSEWGKQVKNNGHTAVFERHLDKDHKVFTFVVWAE